MIIDNIELDENNIEFNYASEFVKQTNRLVYLTGKAGTGKTTFLKFLRETTNKKTVILAPTGVAAVNAGGQTIHSFFQIKPSIYHPNDKRFRQKPDRDDDDQTTIYNHFKYFKERLEVIRSLELLIIDEISMVRCDLLDVVDILLRTFRKRMTEPFGGVQVVLIGDTFQLPPIATSNEWKILKPFYKSPFFFSSRVIEGNKPVYIELKIIYRQNEQEFIDLLNRIRVNQIDEGLLNILNSKLNPSFSPSVNENYITLATHNDSVRSINLIKLNELHTEPIIFDATITGIFPEKMMPTDRQLILKEGAQVIFVKNDQSKRYFNGKIAKINKIDGDQILVELSEDHIITIERQEWNNIKFSWDKEEKRIKEEIIGTFIQFPLKLAWAISVHKSQGLTFEKVFADLGGAFAPGQVYVALSRCTSFNGLILKSRIERYAIKTDPEVISFAKNEIPNTLMVQELTQGKADFYYNKARNAIKDNDISTAYESFINALKYRNDIETDTFKRFITIYLSRQITQKKRFKVDIMKLKDSNQHLLQELDGKRKNLVGLLSEINDLDNQILEDKKVMQQLRSDISMVQNDLNRSKKKTKSLEYSISHKTTEIARLNNLTWYHKLFGKK